MPEFPDFDLIARRLVERLVYDEGKATTGSLVADVEQEFVEQLRQVWNARGAADGAALKAELQRALDAVIVQARVEIDLEPLLKGLDR